MKGMNSPHLHQQLRRSFSRTAGVGSRRRSRHHSHRLAIKDVTLTGSTTAVTSSNWHMTATKDILDRTRVYDSSTEASRAIDQIMSCNSRLVGLGIESSRDSKAGFFFVHSYYYTMHNQDGNISLSHMETSTKIAVSIIIFLFFKKKLFIFIIN